MSLKAKTNNRAGGGDQCPAGIHPGVCVAVIDLGHHWSSYQGSAEQKVRNCYLVWEVEAEQGGADKRFFLGKEYRIYLDKDGNLQLGKKSPLREMLETWRKAKYGDKEDVDVEAVLGRGCQVQVMDRQGTNGKSYAEIEAIVPLPTKGMAPLKPTVTPFTYDVANPTEAYPAPEWVPRCYGLEIGDILEVSLDRGGSGRREELRKKPAAGAVAPDNHAYAQPGADVPGEEIPF